MSIKITCTSTHPDTGSACVLQGEEHDDHGGHHWDGFISTWTDDEAAPKKLLTGQDELTAEEHAQEFGYADPVPASDTRGCVDNDAHLASSRHTAAECPVTRDKIDRAARVDHGTTLNGPEYAWVWGEVVRKGRSVDETVAEVIDGRRDL